MSKKVLILGIVVVLAAGGAAAYAWVSRSQAKDSLNRAWQAVRKLGDKHRPARRQPRRDVPGGHDTGREPGTISIHLDRQRGNRGIEDRLAR